jgi:hypothetical protein
MLDMDAKPNDTSVSSPSSPYCGMTTNERLFAAGLLDAFDTAALARDRARMIELLMTTDFSRPDAEQMADSVLACPDVYGF